MKKKYPKYKYSIQEVVEYLKEKKSIEIEQSYLRFIEKEFDLPIERKKNRRMYSEADINSIEIIWELTKVKGMTIVGAKNAYSNNQPEVVKNHSIITKLEKIKNRLIEIKKEIQ